MENEAGANTKYTPDMILLPPICFRQGRIVKSTTLNRPTSRSIGASKKLYVGNLPFSATEEDLRAVFSEFGVVSQVQIIMDRDTGRSRGFAFVDFAPFEDEGLDGLKALELHGRRLTISEAKPRELR